jgi:hypothetical protein
MSSIIFGRPETWPRSLDIASVYKNAKPSTLTVTGAPDRSVSWVMAGVASRWFTVAVKSAPRVG